MPNEGSTTMEDKKELGIQEQEDGLLALKNKIQSVVDTMD